MDEKNVLNNSDYGDTRGVMVGAVIKGDPIMWEGHRMLYPRHKKRQSIRGSHCYTRLFNTQYPSLGYIGWSGVHLLVGNHNPLAGLHWLVSYYHLFNP